MSTRTSDNLALKELKLKYRMNIPIEMKLEKRIEF